jgi:hypothetical protein
VLALATGSSDSACQGKTGGGGRWGSICVLSGGVDVVTARQPPDDDESMDLDLVAAAEGPGADDQLGVGRGQGSISRQTYWQTCW